MRKIIFISFVIFSIFNSNAQIRIKAYDEYLEPIYNVTFVTQDGSHFKTDKKKEVEIVFDLTVKFPQRIDVYCPGYQDEIITLESKNDDCVTVLKPGKSILYEKERLKYIPHQLLQTDIYFDAVRKLDSTRNKEKFYVQSIDNYPKKYNLNKESSFEIQKIKDIKILKDSIKLTYFKPYVYYNVGYTGSLGLQYVKDENLPVLQNIYSQGAGSFEEGSPFSYGTNLQNLEFKGVTNLYDENGKVVLKGNGNGKNVIPYENSVLNNSIKSSHHAFFNVSHEDKLVRLSFSNQTSKDIFGKEQNSSNKITLKFSDFFDYYNSLKAFVSYQGNRNNMPNINGFQNNVLLNNWATPVSFDNNQGAILPTNEQRSFNSNFNNPQWLLDFNKNKIDYQNFVTGFQSKFLFLNEFSINSDTNYNFNNEEQQFSLPSKTVGFVDGFLSTKKIRQNKFSSSLSHLFSIKSLYVTSSLNYIYDDLKYNFKESNAQPISFDISRNALRLSNKVKWGTRDIKLCFINNSYYSSIQNNKWFLPSVTVKLDVDKVLDLRYLKFRLYTNFSLDVNDSPLYYTNLSHNSLLIKPKESLSYTTNNDLFISKLLGLEEKQNLDIGIKGKYRYRIKFDFTYFRNKTEGSVFPVLENGKFQLKNVADIQDSGIDFTIKSRVHLGYVFDEKLVYRPKISFSKNRTKVLRLWDNRKEVAIAGFSSVSKQLIEGESAGVIVGTAYQRDTNNDLIIGNNGFPLVDATPQVIGDPTPDFTIGFSNTFVRGGFQLGFTIDYQKGGDIWNGTQNTLNYLGKSEQSAMDRNSNYNSNTISSKNKFVHNGFSGVAEDAIEDASYFNLKSLYISYKFIDSKGVIENLVVELYADNLVTFSKFKGYSPYSTLYGNQSAIGLNFFNTPITSEVGLTLKIKI